MSLPAEGKAEVSGEGSLLPTTLLLLQIQPPFLVQGARGHRAGKGSSGNMGIPRGVLSALLLTSVSP